MRFAHTLALIGSPAIVLVAASFETGRHGNPPVDRQHTIQENMVVPPKIDAMLHRSCYDCHSVETHWPWYSQVSGIGNLIEHDVVHGREAMNFSEWSTGAGKTPMQSGSMLLAACEAVRQKRMPKPNYLKLHPEAAPTAAEMSEFCSWANNQAGELMRSGAHQ